MTDLTACQVRALCSELASTLCALRNSFGSLEFLVCSFGYAYGNVRREGSSETKGKCGIC